MFAYSDVVNGMAYQEDGSHNNSVRRRALIRVDRGAPMIGFKQRPFSVVDDGEECGDNGCA